MSSDAINAAQAEKLPVEQALAALAAAVKAKNPALAEGLLCSPNKALQKAAKKALYQLKSQGVAVKEPERMKPVEPPKAPEPKDEPPAVLSTVLGTGERALLFVRSMRGGGLELYQCVVSDEHGILQLDRAETSRANHRKHIEQLKHDRVLFVPVARAFEVLSAAWGQNLSSKTALPNGAEMTLHRLSLTPTMELPPLPPPEAGDVAKSALGHTLHQEPELRPWLPPEKEIAVLAQRLDEVRVSPLQLSEAQKKEQSLQKVQLSAKEFFVGPVRKLYGRRLWAVAELLEAQGRSEPAAIARAEARRLFHEAEGITRFGEGMFEKVWELSQVAAAQREGAPVEPAAAHPAPEQRTSGGLIIP